MKHLLGNSVVILAVLVAICTTSRLLFLGEYLEGWDSIDFALGLHDYDIEHYQPHFPGYPVYMFLCRLVHLFTDNDVLALKMPGVILGSATLAPLYYLAKRMFSKDVALLTAFIYIVNPLCWLQSEKAYSDTVGLFFIILSAQMLFFALTSGRNALRYLITGSLMLAISLGVRLSYFPFVILWFYVLYTQAGSNRGYAYLYFGSFSFIIGICIWLLPLIYYVGLSVLVKNGLYFIFGHFSDWGGSVVTSHNLFSRFSSFIWCFFCNGLGFWWYDTHLIRILPSLIMGTGMVLYLKQIRFDQTTKFIIFYSFPYFLWVFFGQNLEKARHVLPLIPLIIICICAGLVRLRDSKYTYFRISLSSLFCRGPFSKMYVGPVSRLWPSPYYLSVGILLICLSVISIKLAYAHKSRPIAQIQLLKYFENNFDNPSTRIYCWETKRFFDYYAPSVDSRRARNVNDLKYDVGSSLIVPEVILTTSKVNGVNSAMNKSKIIAEFENNRYVNNPYHKLTLYDLSAFK